MNIPTQNHIIDNIDFSPLMENPENLFIVRFNNLDPDSQTRLASRIKETARQRTIRKNTGPSIETIHTALIKLNPIIFSEHIIKEEERSNYRPKKSYRNFNFYEVTSISGYRFHDLCKAIYYILYAKKPMNQDKMTIIAATISNNWNSIRQILRNRDTEEQNNEEEQHLNNNLDVLGIQEIERARINTEQRDHTSQPTIPGSGGRAPEGPRQQRSPLEETLSQSEQAERDERTFMQPLRSYPFPNAQPIQSYLYDELILPDEEEDF